MIFNLKSLNIPYNLIYEEMSKRRLGTKIVIIQLSLEAMK